MVHIKKSEFGFLLKRGDFIKLLQPGTYFYPSFLEYSVEIHGLYAQIVSQIHPEIFLEIPVLKDKVEIILVSEAEICIHLENNAVIQVLNPGRYIFWKNNSIRKFIKIDITNPEIPEDFQEELLTNPALKPYLIEYTIQSFQCGLLHINGKYLRRLEAGRYRFWNTKNSVLVYIVDKRLQNLEITGQELMTEDKITLRLNLSCQYLITNPERAMLEIQNFTDQLHIFLQLILRDFVSGWRLDILLEKREDASKSILEKMKLRETEFGVSFKNTGIKDIILPGDIKEILNTVLLAEKKAQANVIMRREETASTRSLLNTAKLLDENPTLLKLKEWEHLEKILEKVDTLQLSSRGNVMEQLEELFNKKA